jgi:excisionase family DNA binding protein
MSEFLSTKQLAARLGVSIRTVERMRQEGKGPAFYRVSSGLRRGRVAYREAAVNAWLAGRECQSTISPLGASQ